MTDNTLITMSRTLWGEGRGEGPRGMQAIANVILMRAAKPRWWGHDIVSVCLQPYQFSCWLASDPNRPKLLAATTDDPSYDLARAIARVAIGAGLQDITGGADSYFASGSPVPVWAKSIEPVAVIGRHQFYRLV
jgi:spore germination cell wall hydrolase CwlJ-like protein